MRTFSYLSRTFRPSPFSTSLAEGDSRGDLGREKCICGVVRKWGFHRGGLMLRRRDLRAENTRNSMSACNPGHEDWNSQHTTLASCKEASSLPQSFKQPYSIDSAQSESSGWPWPCGWRCFLGSSLDGSLLGSTSEPPSVGEWEGRW